MTVIEAIHLRSTSLKSFEIFSVIVVVWILGFIFTRLYFHPLSKFSGPRLAALTTWYEFYQDVLNDGNYLKYYPELHKKFGRTPHILHR